jgi:SET domain-containing protein 6
MALVVRIREKRALKAMAAWARHPCRSEEDLLPPLRSSDVVERKAGSKVRGACCERDCEREGRTCEAN